jgi:hypothetical protein
MRDARLAFDLLQTRQELERSLKSRYGLIDIRPHSLADAGFRMFGNANDPLQSGLLYNEFFEELAGAGMFGKQGSRQALDKLLDGARETGESRINFCFKKRLVLREATRYDLKTCLRGLGVIASHRDTPPLWTQNNFRGSSRTG